LPPVPMPMPRTMITPPTGSPNAKFPVLANLPTMVAELDESSDSGARPAPELASTQIAPPILPPHAPTRPPMDRFEPDAQTQEASAYQGSPAMLGLQTLGAQMGIPPPPPSQLVGGAVVGGSLGQYRPFDNDASQQQYHPSGYPQQQAMPLDSGQYPAPNPNIISPVGPGYPQVDWTAAANAPARAMPKWLLAIVFVGAIGLALALTIIIAKLAR